MPYAGMLICYHIFLLRATVVLHSFCYLFLVVLTNLIHNAGHTKNRPPGWVACLIKLFDQASPSGLFSILKLISEPVAAAPTETLSVQDHAVRPSTAAKQTISAWGAIYFFIFISSLSYASVTGAYLAYRASIRACLVASRLSSSAAAVIISPKLKVYLAL